MLSVIRPHLEPNGGFSAATSWTEDVDFFVELSGGVDISDWEPTAHCVQVQLENEMQLRFGRDTVVIGSNFIPTQHNSQAQNQEQEMRCDRINTDLPQTPSPSPTRCRPGNAKLHVVPWFR